ncbi:MAG: hypothetical protein AAFV07_07770 [Bacteroidota bacterium]
MSDARMTPKESLNLISEVLQEAKARQQENGLIYLYWGIIIVVATLAHFYLNMTGQYQYIYFAYMIFPVAGVMMYFLFRKYFQARKRTGNVIGRILTRVWFFVGANLMVLGFAFPMILAEHLIPFILMLSGLAIFVSGVAVNNRALIIGGTIANSAGIGTLFVPPTYQPLVMAIATVFSQIIPGILLYQAYLKRQHV